MCARPKFDLGLAESGFPTRKSKICLLKSKDWRARHPSTVFVLYKDQL